MSQCPRRNNINVYFMHMDHVILMRNPQCSQWWSVATLASPYGATHIVTKTVDSLAYHIDTCMQDCGKSSALKVDYLIICIICDTDSVNELTLQMYTIHKYE